MKSKAYKILIFILSIFMLSTVCIGSAVVSAQDKDEIGYYAKSGGTGVGSKMLHITSQNVGPLGQLLSAKPKEVYMVEVTASNNLAFSVVAHDGTARYKAIDAKIKYISGKDEGKYALWTYEVTMPEILEDKGNNVLLGVKFGGTAPYDGYLMNISVYKKGDSNKTELFKNTDFAGNVLDYWRFEYINFTGDKVGLSKYTIQDDSKDIKLEIVNFDKSVMENVAAKFPDYSRKMIYFKNGPEPQIFSAWVDCVPGRKFIVTYSIFSTSSEIIPNFNKNGLRQGVKTKPELLEEVKHGNYTTYTYRMTIPQDYDASEKLIFLGFVMPFYSEGYLFDIECYVEGDSPKNSAWKNPEFAYGFNEWVWGWSVTFFTRLGDRVKEWTDGVQEIKLVPFDLSKIDTLIGEINRDDGQWWEPSDIIQNEDKAAGTASITGTFKDQNGTPVTNATMILKSVNNTYKKVTDKNGAFAFKNVVADYYEIYYLNSEGKEVLTDFAYLLENGYVIKINLVSDTSEQAKALVSSLNGAVYTSDLKTVPNLKLILRGFGEAVTGKDGSFTFTNVPVGEYELYTVLEDGSEYVFRTVEIKGNIDLTLKLKYDSKLQNVNTERNGVNWIWFIVVCVTVVIIIAAAVFFIILKKKQKSN